jgi:putative membrane protein
MHLTAEEAHRVEARAAELERDAGVQVMAAVVGRADAYPEIPWKAFALGAALALLAALGAPMLQPEWSGVEVSALEALLVLCVGGAAALATAYLPPFARLFLDRDRANAEVRQYADAMFLARGLHGTARRTGILLLVSLFEHEVAIRCDRGIAARVPDAELESVIAAMAPSLKRGAVADALVDGLGGLERMLRGRGFPGGGPDEIAEELIQEKGR